MHDNIILLTTGMHRLMPEGTRTSETVSLFLKLKEQSGNAVDCAEPDVEEVHTERVKYSMMFSLVEKIMLGTKGCAHLLLLC